MKWFLWIVSFLNILVFALTLGGYLGSYIDPHQFSLLQVIGLFMPWLLLVNLFFLFLWLVLRKKMFWLPLITLLLGYFHIGRFIGFNFGQKDVFEHALMLGTFNSESYNESDNLKKFLQSLKEKEQIDILCLQEISPNQISVLTEGIGLKHQYFHKGKIIATRFPIESEGNIQFDKSVNGCIWVDLKLSSGQTIRVYNIHLRSNGVSHEAEGLMNEINADGRAALSKFRGMLSNYQRATKIRSDQVAEITAHLTLCEKPILLAGDMNDTPFSYAYQRINALLIDQFTERGLGIGTTFAGDLPGLKIDYIFADENFTSLNHRIIRTKISDHFPVLSQMKLNN